MIQQVHKGGEPNPRHVEFTLAPGPWDGPSDPAYLLGEIEELRLAAQKGGYGTLAYLLNCAAEEARTQARLRASR
jgi:hypothetical protein